jgi:hypothetical protein
MKSVGDGETFKFKKYESDLKIQDVIFLLKENILYLFSIDELMFHGKSVTICC